MVDLAIDANTSQTGEGVNYLVSDASRGSAGYFPGTGRGLYASGSRFAFGTGDFTVEFYVYPITGGKGNNYGRLLETKIKDTGDGGLILQCGTGDPMTIGVESSGPTFFLESSATVPNNTWTHVELSRESAVLRLFINGLLRGSTTTNYNFNATDCSIGSRIGSALELFKGRLSGYRILKGVALHTANFTPEELPWPVISPVALALSGLPAQQAINVYAAPETISGAVTVSGNGGAQEVIIREVTTRLLIATATPDPTTGAWTAQVPPGDYDISYFAPDCQPICHGPYTVAPP